MKIAFSVVVTLLASLTAPSPVLLQTAAAQTAAAVMRPENPAPSPKEKPTPPPSSKKAPTQSQEPVPARPQEKRKPEVTPEIQKQPEKAQVQDPAKQESDLEAAVKPITFAAVGDIMLGSSYPAETGLPENDGSNLLTEVEPVLSSVDVTFGNLEGPMLEGGATKKCPPNTTRCYAFRVPTRYGMYLKRAGFDVMSLANNHAMDFGFEGRASSMRVLDSLGIAHSGQIGDVARLTVNGKKIEVIAFSTYNTSYNLNDLETAKSLVERSAARADLVVVSFHGGAEGAKYQRVPEGAEIFLGENRGDLRRFSRAMIDAGADLVLGHGPHVVRGLELYGDRLIAYSLGNFATYGSFNLNGPNGLSLILEATLAPDGSFIKGRIHPVKQEKPGGPRFDPDNTILPLIKQLSIDDFGDRAPVITEDGEILPPSGSPRSATPGRR